MRYLGLLLLILAINLNVNATASTLMPGRLSEAQYQTNQKDVNKLQKTQDDKKPAVFNTAIPQHDLDIILGRPTQNSITVSLMTSYPSTGRILYGEIPEDLSKEIAPFELTPVEPIEIEISGLYPDKTYHYQVEVENKNNGAVKRTGSFSTQRSIENPFKFAVQADSHLDQNTDISLYIRTLNHIKRNHPDFIIDLGDTFMTDKYRADYTKSKDQYLAQRYYFGLVGASIPLYLVLGNHDGEAGYRLSLRPDNMTLWANTQRKRYFPNPYPDSFYRGNTMRHENAGLLENYYSWEWGNGLFIVLDPYWYTLSKSKSVKDNWNETLGIDQYTWLKETLESSKAKFKFVFIHQLIGGSDRNGRGGVEAVHLFEWGGYNIGNEYQFKENRPMWEMPIHDLLVKHNVSAVFHGHDHFFAKQELDAIVYQLVPQPGHRGNKYPRQAKEYGYEQGEILGGSGYLLVEVTDEVTVSFMKNTTDADGNASLENTFSYQLPTN